MAQRRLGLHGDEVEVVLHGAVLDTGQYPIGISYSDKDIAALPLLRHNFHGDWNYTLLPGNTP
jgi:hypothetical protein